MDGWTDRPTTESLIFTHPLQPPFPQILQSEWAGLGLFGAVDIGQGAYWWDYGQLKLYFANSIRVTEVRTEKNEEGEGERLAGYGGAVRPLLVPACMQARSNTNPINNPSPQPLS